MNDYGLSEIEDILNISATNRFAEENKILPKLDKFHKLDDSEFILFLEEYTKLYLIIKINYPNNEGVKDYEAIFEKIKTYYLGPKGILKENEIFTNYFLSIQKSYLGSNDLRNIHTHHANVNAFIDSINRLDPLFKKIINYKFYTYKTNSIQIKHLIEVLNDTYKLVDKDEDILTNRFDFTYLFNTIKKIIYDYDTDSRTHTNIASMIKNHTINLSILPEIKNLTDNLNGKDIDTFKKLLDELNARFGKHKQKYKPITNLELQIKIIKDFFKTHNIIKNINSNELIDHINEFVTIFEYLNDNPAENINITLKDYSIPPVDKTQTASDWLKEIFKEHKLNYKKLTLQFKIVEALNKIGA